MARVITVMAPKGGVGKTTTVFNLARIAGREGRRVLIVDSDPQCNLTMTAAADPRHPGLYDILEKETPARDVIQQVEGLDIISANANLIGARTFPGSARRLEKALDPIRKRYSFIFIDTGPRYGELQNNAGFAADDVLMLAQADLFSQQATFQGVSIIRQIQKDRPATAISGVVITMYDGRTRANRVWRDKIEDTAGQLAIDYLGEIRQSTTVKDSLMSHRSVAEMYPHSKPAEDYLALYKTVCKPYTKK